MLSGEIALINNNYYYYYYVNLGYHQIKLIQKFSLVITRPMSSERIGKNGGGASISVHESQTAIEIDINNSNCEVIWAEV